MTRNNEIIKTNLLNKDNKNNDNNTKDVNILLIISGM